MAGDWIKMRTDLYRDPKVCLMADLLLDVEGELGRYVNQNRQRDMTVTRNVTRNATVGALVTVWGICRIRGKRIDNDLLISGASISIIDDIADLPGFGTAMKQVGWVVETKRGLIFPRFFEEYNSEPTPAQSLSNAERQRRFREKRNGVSNALRNVTNNEPCNDRVEKSREEKKEEEEPPLPPATGGNGSESKSNSKSDRKPKPDPAAEVPIPPELDSPEFRSAWADWQADRKARGKKLTERGARDQLAALIPLGSTGAIACIRQSIRQGWTGLFPERIESASRPPPPQKESRPEMIARLEAERKAREQPQGTAP